MIQLSGCKLLLFATDIALQADCIEGRLLVNPGSATGAFNTFKDDVVPSFVLMDISSKKVTSLAFSVHCISF